MSPKKKAPIRSATGARKPKGAASRDVALYGINAGADWPAWALDQVRLLTDTAELVMKIVRAVEAGANREQAADAHAKLIAFAAPNIVRVLRGPWTMTDDERLLVAVRAAQSPAKFVAVMKDFGAPDDQVSRAQTNKVLVERTIEAFSRRHRRASPLSRVTSPDKWQLLEELAKHVLNRRRIDIIALQKMDTRRKTSETAKALRS